MTLTNADPRDGSLLTYVREITSSLDLNSVIQATVNSARDLLSADLVVLLMLEDARLYPAATSPHFEATPNVGDSIPAASWPDLQQSAPWAILDTSTDSRWARLSELLPLPPTTSSWLGGSLSIGGRCLGVIGCGFRDPHTFDQDSLDGLQVLADVAATAIRNALQLEEEAERAHLATLRGTFYNSLQLAETISDVSGQAAEAICRAFGTSWTSILITHSTGLGQPVFACADVKLRHLDKRTESAVGAILHQLMQRPRHIIIDDFANNTHGDASVAMYKEALLCSGTRAIMCAPITRGAETIGALFVLQLDSPRKWTDGERLLIEQFASDIGTLAHGITRLESLEKRFREAESERAIFETLALQAPLGLVVANMPPHSLRFWNTAAASVAIEGSTMVAPADSAAPRFEAYRLDGSEYSQDEWPLTRAFNEGVAISSEESLLRKRDASFASVLVSAAPTNDPLGRVTGSAATIQDVTQLRLAERKSKSLERRSNALVEAIEALAGSTSIIDVLEHVFVGLRDILPSDAFAARFLGKSDGALERTWPSGTVQDDQNGTLNSKSLLNLIGASATRQVGEIDAAILTEVADDGQAFGSAITIPIGHGELRGDLIVALKAAGAYGEAEVALASQLGRVISVVWMRQLQAQNEILAATRDERDRLARELHDVLAQMITSIVLQLEHVLKDLQETDATRAPIEQVRTLARSAIAETRRIVWNLRSAGAILEEPRAVVEEEALKLERRIGIKPDVLCTGDERRLAPEIGAVIQRLARVALDNIWSHSDAKHVRIVVDFGLQALTLLIEDDGRGFDPDEIDLMKAGRVGLSGVAERLRVVGGTLRIESAANQGTRVWGEVPYTPAAPTPKARPTVPVALETEATSPTQGQSEPGARIRVVLIDDHSMVREGLEHMLSAEPDLQVVGAAATGSDGLRIIKEQRPDVVLCDLQLPDISGVEVISRVRTLFPDVRCVIVTTYDQDDMMYEGIKSGAKGYVLKDVSGHELAEAVRAAARNESLLQPVVAGKLLERFGEMARQGDMVEPLTDREIEVLQSLAKGSRNKEIALQLGLSESTIKTHLASIFGKLGVTTRTEAVTRGRELGLVPL